MFLSAIMHGMSLLFMSFMFRLMLQVAIPLLFPPDLMALDTPFAAVFTTTMQTWVQISLVLIDVCLWVGLASAVLTVITSFGWQYAALLRTRPHPPVTVSDHFALIAEHDSAIAYANHVIRSLDTAIQNRWPSHK